MTTVIIIIAIWLGSGLLAGLFYYMLDLIKKERIKDKERAEEMFRQKQREQASAMGWTPVYLSKPYKLVGAFRDNIIYYKTDLFPDQWFACGKVVGNKVFSDNFLVGRVEKTDRGYLCILDFRDDKKSSLESHEDFYKECSSPAILDLINKTKAHPEEYSVAEVTTSQSSVSPTGYLSCVSLTYKYCEEAEDRASTPQHIRDQWWFDYPVFESSILMHSQTPDAFELAAVFVCLQHQGYLEESIRPFYRMYP